MNKKARLILIGITIWMLLQLPRFIAIPLIQDVLAGSESEAWFFPAILDVLIAASVPFVIYLIWKKRNFTAWIVIIIFFVISIVDHMDSVTADLITTTPKIFGGEEGPQPIVVSSLQGVVDIIALIFLSSRLVKNEFFKLGLEN